MRPHSLLAYDASGVVIATLDYLVARDADGEVIGLVDFAAQEEAGGDHTDFWTVQGAKGSKVWPEWLGTAAHGLTVELAGEPGRRYIATLVHPDGRRRVRAGIEAAIAARIAAADGQPADIRDLVGGPSRPLRV